MITRSTTGTAQQEFFKALAQQNRLGVSDDVWQAQRVSGLWLALQRRVLGWSDDMLLRRTGLSSDALLCLETGTAYHDLGTDTQWSNVATLLSDEEHDEDFVMTVILIALGLYDGEDAEIVEHIVASLKLKIVQAEELSEAIALLPRLAG